MNARARLLTACAALTVASSRPLRADGYAADDGAVPPAASAGSRGWLDRIADLGSRAPGHSGNQAIEAMVMRAFGASGFASGALHFEAPVFQPGATVVEFTDGTACPVLPLHPTLMRPGNFATGAFSATLVYLGRGTPDDLDRVRGVPLEDSLAVMEFACGDRWLDLLRFGMAGFIFLESGDCTHADAVAKVYNAETGVPRFYATAETAAILRDRFAERLAVAINVTAEPSRMAAETLRSPWVLVPGYDPEAARDVLLLTAPLDANSVVPELAHGGDSAGNPALLLELLDRWRAAPPRCSVLLVGVNAHTAGYLGERLLAWHLLQERSDISRLRDELARELRRSGVFVEHYRGLRFERATLTAEELYDALNVLWALYGSEPPTALDGFDNGALRRAIDQAIETLETRLRGFGARLFMTDDTRAHERAVLQRLDRMRGLDASALRERLAAALPVFEDEQMLEDWRDAVDTSAGVRIIVKSMLQDRVKRELNIVKLTQMTLARDGVDDPDVIAELRESRESLTRLLVLFNKIDIGFGRERIRYRTIAGHDPDRARLADLRDLIVAELEERMRLFTERLERDVANGDVRDALGTQQVKLAIALGMDWSVDQAGLMALNHLPRQDWFRRFGDLIAPVANVVEPDAGRDRPPYVDTLSSAVGLPQETFFMQRQTPAGLFHAAGGVPALTLRPLYAGVARAFTPRNSIADGDRDAMRARLRWFADFIVALTDTPGLMASGIVRSLSVPANMRLWSCLVRTFEMDEFAAKPTPSLPVPDSIVAAYPRTPPPARIVDGEVANVFGALCDTTGFTILYGLPESPLVPAAYTLDRDRHARVVATIDKGRVQQARQIDSNLYRTTNKTLPMFSAAEFMIRDRRDPSILGARPVAIGEFWVFSGESRSAPQKYGVHGARSLSRAYAYEASGPVGIYQEFRARRGTSEPLMIMTGNRRFAVNPDAEEPEGRGYASAHDMQPDFFLQAARDMNQVIRHRLAAMTGIVNELVDEFLALGQVALEAAETAQREVRDYNRSRRETSVAIGNLAKAYGQIREMNDDMLKAIMIYMALMLPFCYFLQKLVFNFTRVEHEMLTFAALFVVTYTGFRFIHPAFSIAMSPEAIFLAFVLGTVGVFVVAMLHSRFSAEMDLLFRGAAGFADERTTAFVGQTAMIIGVNNMKRRRTRTTLTTATIVLVVFTMLAFSSVSRKARPSLILRSADAPYTGLLFTWPGGSPMDEGSVRVFEALFAGPSEMLVRRVLRPESSAGDVVARWIIERSGPVAAQAELTSLLSLSDRERRFAGDLPLEYGRSFSAERARELILPATLADALGIGAAETGTAVVRLLGLDLTVVGVLDDDRYRALRDLDPRMPLLPVAGLDLGEGVEGSGRDTGATVFVDLSTMAFLPSGLLRDLGGLPYSVSIRLADDAVAASDRLLWTSADTLLRTTDASFIMGSVAPFRVGDEARRSTEGGVYQVTGSYRTTIGGLSRLVVPLLIAGLILFNTMLGTVYERKSEIAIYNAIGLNPRHIFVFFLAEALVYGVIGAIGGYLIGQIAAMISQSFNLVRGMNVNFSSLMVVWAILFTVGLVLLSTVYPAWVATRTAVPSGTRRWSLPDHDGNTMRVDLPFIYEPNLAGGVMAYLHGLFSACVEGAVNEMLVTVRSLEARQQDGHPVLRAEYGVALAPYDLGVTQALCVEARYEPKLDSYGMQLEIRRESGQDTSWVAVNQPMLERVRKALLRWRNMDPAAHQEYVVTGRKLFEV